MARSPNTSMPARHPMLDSNGRVTPEWHSYFANLGGASNAPSGGGSSDTTIIKTVLVGGGAAPPTEVPVSDTSLLADLPPVPNTILQTDAANVISWSPLNWDKLPSGSGTWVASPTIGGPLVVNGPATVNPLITPRITSPSVPSATNLLISPTGNLLLGPVGLGVLPPSNYVVDVGTPTQKFHSGAFGEFATDNLVPPSVRSILGGRVMVSATTGLVEDLTGIDTTMYVRDSSLAANDIVVLEARGQVEWLRVTGALSFLQASPPKYGYPVARNLNGLANAPNWIKGDGVVNTHVPGYGFIDLYATHGVVNGTGVTLVGDLRTGTIWNQIEPRWALGNLNGLYGYTTDVFGSSFGNPAQSWIKIDDTGGVRIGNGSTVVVNVPPTGPQSITVTGNITAGFFYGDGSHLTNLPGGGTGTGGMDLDYLGNFATGPTYNDGDIVIAADGIAYLCVVDGTTAAPVPWPGVGIATSVGPPGPPGPTGPQGPAGVDAAVDATYWTVTPHATLTNERALATLANGYVKSTAGVPSTVAVIPVAEGGTGSTTASTARTALGVGNVGTLNTNGNAATFLDGNGNWSSVQSVPSGLIAMFTTACPAGWTRVATFDGYFLRGAAAYGGSGGSSQHNHGTGTLAVASHTHSISVNGPNHNHGGSVSISGTTGNNGGHSHYFTQTVGTSTSSVYTTVSTGSGVSMPGQSHTHQVTVSANTDPVGDHSHTFSGSGGISNDGGQLITGNTGAAAPGLTGSTDVQNHLPPYIDVVFCQKS